jgi:hypothetical protein
MVWSTHHTCLLFAEDIKTAWQLHIQIIQTQKHIQKRTNYNSHQQINKKKLITLISQSQKYQDGEDNRFLQNVGGKPPGKHPLGLPRRWENNTKMDLKELHRLHGGRCMYVSQGYVQWSTMV